MTLFMQLVNAGHKMAAQLASSGFMRFTNTMRQCNLVWMILCLLCGGYCTFIITQVLHAAYTKLFLVFTLFLT